MTSSIKHVRCEASWERRLFTNVFCRQNTRPWIVFNVNMVSIKEKYKLNHKNHAKIPVGKQKHPFHDMFNCKHAALLWCNGLDLSYFCSGNAFSSLILHYLESTQIRTTPNKLKTHRSNYLDIETYLRNEC
jgi:hypothetical protein